MINRLEGIFCPITTPFKTNGEVDYEKLRENTIKLSESGLTGLVVLGSNGEYVSLTYSEKLKVVETVAESAANNIEIIVGSGCESTYETLKLTEESAALGAKWALVITPAYYKGMVDTPKAIKAHYNELAKNSPIPVLLYNVPKYTGVSLGIETIVELSHVDNIAGIKDSSGNVAVIGELVERVPDSFSVLVGTAGALLTSLILGCQGGVLALANTAPRECVKIYNLFKEGKVDEAVILQRKMLPVNRAVTGTFGIAGLKYTMEEVGFHGGETRLPIMPLSAEEKDKLKSILKKAELI